jgi:hypothetical protein
VILDPSYASIRIDSVKHPELRDPAKLRSYLQSQRPWFVYPTSDGPNSVSAFSIRPAKIPRGDQLLLVAHVSGQAVVLGPLIVRSLPRCFPAA